MTDDTNPELEAELTTIMPGNAPLANLRALHMGGATYRVLSARNGSATVHKVDLGEVTCTCEDMEYNKEGRDVCAHAAKAALAHPSQVTAESQMAHTLMSQAESLHDLTDKVRETAHQAEQSLVSVRDLQAGAQAVEEQVESGDPEPDTSPPEPDVNALKDVREWIDENYPQPQLVSCEEGDHGGTAGVRLEPDNRTMTDGQYEMFKGLVNSIDESTAHVGFTDEGCNSCNSDDDSFWYHIPSSAVEEL
jgi:hypothetical protein